MAQRGRPKKYDKRKSTGVRLPVDLHERLVQVARERETSVNHLLCKAAAAYLDRLPPLP